MAEQEEKKMIGDGESETKEVGSLESLSEPKLEQQHDSLQFSTNMVSLTTQLQFNFKHFSFYFNTTRFSFY